MNLLTTASNVIRRRLSPSGRAWFAVTGAALLCALPSNASPEPSYIYTDSSLSDGPFLKSWMVCGPFPNSDVTETPEGEWIHGAACTGLYTDYLAPLGRIASRARAGR